MANFSKIILKDILDNIVMAVITLLDGLDTTESPINFKNSLFRYIKDKKWEQALSNHIKFERNTFKQEKYREP